ncbi:MAG: hypothetical protein A4E67_01542 [Syntrophaceae bacterium PtaB.Bin038]|nr:MAG: hypothetical protein A4E67_01542 [Syntrophaceae bacterium PtaB.Bin038]
MGGTVAEEPVAMTQDAAERGSPSRLTVCSSAKAGLPNSTRAPSPQKRSVESCRWIAAITERIRSATRAKSTGGTSASGSP